ncbi:unnamed protein product [Bathycoccus prasinos]
MRSQNEADDRERMRALRERLETFRTTNTNTTNTQQEHLRRRGGEEELFHDDGFKGRELVVSPVRRIKTTLTTRRGGEDKHEKGNINNNGECEDEFGFSARSPPHSHSHSPRISANLNLGKPRRIPIGVVETAKENTTNHNRGDDRNTTSSSKDNLGNFLRYQKETRQRKDAEFAVASAVESARSKIFMEVTNFLNEELLPEDADVVSVAICQKFAELAVRNQRLVRSASEAREIIDRLSAELNSFRDSCEQ